MIYVTMNLNLSTVFRIMKNIKETLLVSLYLKVNKFIRTKKTTIVNPHPKILSFSKIYKIIINFMGTYLINQLEPMIMSL